MSIHIRSANLILAFALAAACLGCQDDSKRDSQPDWTPKSVQTMDLQGKEVLVPNKSDGLAQVFIFSRVDCPISNRYSKEVGRICHTYVDKGVEFYLVFVDPAETPEIVHKHVEEFAYDIPVLRDPKHNLVNLVKATVTPEVAVFSRRQGLVYLGRIDDQYVDFGKQRNEPNHRDLRETLDAILEQRKLSFRTTKAIGCYIEDLK